jgi:chromosome segregation ATPase
MNKREIDNLKQQVSKLQNKSNQGSPNSVWLQDEIVNLLATVTNHLSERQQQEENYNTAIARLSSIETDIANIRRDIESLCKVVRDGNGQPSMIHRLTNLETIVANNVQDIAEVRTHANSIVAAKALSKSQVMAGLAGMILTALLSSMALIATLLK